MYIIGFKQNILDHLYHYFPVHALIIGAQPYPVSTHQLLHKAMYPIFSLPGASCNYWCAPVSAACASIYQNRTGRHLVISFFILLTAPYCQGDTSI